MRRVVLLIDARRGLMASDRKMMDDLEAMAMVYQVVLTKTDTLAVSKIQLLVDTMMQELSQHTAAFPLVLATSARRALGIAELRASLAELAAKT